MTAVSGNEFAGIGEELKALSARLDSAKAAAEARARAIPSDPLHDATIVVPDAGLAGFAGLAAELEALGARVDRARAAADARAQGAATTVRYLPVPSPTPPTDGRDPSRSPSRRQVIVALALVLVAIAATIVVARNDGADKQASRSPAVPDATAAVDLPSPAATGVPSTGVPSPATPVPASQVPAPSSATAPVPPPPTPTTVVVESGDSFWSIAEHRVASVKGGAPTEAEVANYWVELVDANRSHLAHAGNPDLIYPGQTFSLP